MGESTVAAAALPNDLIEAGAQALFGSPLSGLADEYREAWLASARKVIEAVYPLIADQARAEEQRRALIAIDHAMQGEFDLHQRSFDELPEANRRFVQGMRRARERVAACSVAVDVIRSQIAGEIADRIHTRRFDVMFGRRPVDTFYAGVRAAEDEARRYGQPSPD